LVFVLIGLQLPYVLEGIKEYSLWQLAVYGGLFSVLVILLRLVWIFPGARLAYWIRKKLLHQNYTMPSTKQMFVVGWTGMRGVVALAAAIALPETLGDGSPFPQRNLIVFLTFSVILVTLVLQGLTLPRLICALGLNGAPSTQGEEEEARRIITSTALASLERARGEDLPEFTAVYDDIAEHYTQRLSGLSKTKQQEDELSNKQMERYRALIGELLKMERKTAVGLRNDGRISDEVFRKIEHELDLSETRLELS
jgi:CPA1 family monovalent cation:H+ antiporter